MSSPDQHGSSGLTDSDSSAESTDYPPPHRYASIPPGERGNYNFYTHPARTSVLSSSGALLLDPSLRRDSTGQPGPSDMEQPVYTSDMANVWRSSGSVPSFSRAFDIFSAVDDPDAEAEGVEERFFVPSYLQSSTYVKKLEEAHRLRLISQQEAKRSKGNASDLNNSTLHSTSLPPGSHRGISHTVLERSSSLEEEDSLPPLPTKLNKDDMWNAIEIHSDGLGLKHVGQRNHPDRDHEASAVRADHFMPPQCGIYYFEVRILSGKREDTTIAIGFSTKAAATSRPVGWEAESWGYHGDDGRCFTGQNIGRHYGPTFNHGDVVGCGVNFRDRTAFFTKNGVKLDDAFHDIKGKLYPSVSLKKPGEEILVNFGQEPFIYNIDDMMNGQRARVQEAIENADTSQLEPGMSETDLIQSLVLQFLQHDGYVETARAFAEDMKLQKEALSLDPEATVPGVSIKDDEDANNRQRIRRAILEGDIDRALKLTNACYPQVLRDNEQVYFKLRCRKFIEMVRKAAQLSMVYESKSSNGHSAQEMDLDESHGWGDNMMDTDSGDQAELMRLETNMLEYGQTLQAEYSNDPRKEISKALNEIWALVAYRNPLKEPQVSHLLDRKGRAAVAEELNSAILSSLGKSSRAALEKLYAQTSVLLEDLRQDGGAGAFVSLQDVVDGIQQFPQI
ncbi:Ran-binding protein 9 [Cladobotryum mycophilum]|uniref:Ran-binding protein 9 n=1 Tax=Cladobotryum mycophilum TaxID=491253 RepID=A0ABR0SJV1_9HYPO